MVACSSPSTFFLFFVFWSDADPMYFVIGVWGGATAFTPR